MSAVSSTLSLTRRRDSFIDAKLPQASQQITPHKLAKRQIVTRLMKKVLFGFWLGSTRKLSKI